MIWTHDLSSFIVLCFTSIFEPILKLMLVFASARTAGCVLLLSTLMFFYLFMSSYLVSMCPVESVGWWGSSAPLSFVRWACRCPPSHAYTLRMSLSCVWLPSFCVTQIYRVWLVAKKICFQDFLFKWKLYFGWNWEFDRLK